MAEKNLGKFGCPLFPYVMENQTDDQIAVAMITKAKQKFFVLNSCSFDKGFHSPWAINKRQTVLTAEFVG